VTGTLLEAYKIGGLSNVAQGRVMDRMKYYSDMEMRYRKQADNEPASRDKHIADADAWRRLADTANLVAAKQAEMRDWIAAFSR
jgi:hypothetical protein